MIMIRNYIIFPILLVAAGLLCSGQGTRPATTPATSAAQSTDVNVTIDNFSFAPQTLTIKAGTRVVWTNRDDTPHTVVQEDFAFRSKALDTDESFSSTFTKPGMYSYFCTIHPKMTGKIIVK